MRRYIRSTPLLVTLIVLGLLAAVVVYAGVVLSGLPKSMRSLACAEDLASLYGAIERYRQLHNGRNPPSIQALEDGGLMPALKGWDGEPFFTSKGGPGFVYKPSAGPDEPLAACYGVVQHPLVAAWVTGNGQVFYGRMRLRPKYDVTHRRNCIW